MTITYYYLLHATYLGGIFELPIDDVLVVHCFVEVFRNVGVVEVVSIELVHIERQRLGHVTEPYFYLRAACVCGSGVSVCVCVSSGGVCVSVTCVCVCVCM